MRNIINDMAEKFSMGTVRTTAFDPNGWEIGDTDCDIDLTIKHEAGLATYVVIATIYVTGVAIQRELEIVVTDDDLIDQSKLEIDTDETPPEAVIDYISSHQR